MKLSAFIIGLCIFHTNLGYTQGTTCASPNILSLDGILRSYATSSTTGANILCTNNGTTPITWFRITTNALGECPLLNITASDSMAIEVGFYTSCASLLSSSSMCFYNGYGLWAPNENLITPPNTTYYLRIKTSTACTINIAAQNYTPPNENCMGAFPIDTAAINDNNACHHGGPGITPAQVCALTLENTAWYQFYVQDSGYSIITIQNIHCDNGAANNNSGFQIGFFTGSCSALVPINCSNGSGPIVQATTAFLPAGTRVYVAIDGISGSNCTYSLNGFNISSVLNASLKYFSGWKSNRTNMLKWTILNENAGYYILERSVNAVEFSPIGRVNSIAAVNENVSYSFEDSNPPIKAFYRLKQFDLLGKMTVSHTVQISRTELPGLQVSFNNPASSMLNVNLNVESPGKYSSSIINMQGQKIFTSDKILSKGSNFIPLEISSLRPGQYCLIIGNGNQRLSKTFIKQ